MSACTCTRYRIAGPGGETLEGELERDPDCRQHGFPTDRWPAGHPLRVHAREVETARFRNPFDGTLVVQHRLETPRETEARLYQESLRQAQPQAAIEGEA